jgi:hypothetical protein
LPDVDPGDIMPAIGMEHTMRCAVLAEQGIRARLIRLAPAQHAEQILARFVSDHDLPSVDVRDAIVPDLHHCSVFAHARPGMRLVDAHIALAISERGRHLRVFVAQVVKMGSELIARRGNEVEFRHGHCPLDVLRLNMTRMFAI